MSEAAPALIGPDGGLALLDRARADLAEVRTPDEAVAVVRRAEAIVELARIARVGLEVQNDAAEHRLRTYRRAGELLAATVEHRGGWAARNESHGGTQLPEGVSRNESSRWQAISRLAEDEFERYITGTRARGQELSLKRLERIARERGSRPVVDDNGAPAEQLGGPDLRVCDLRDLVLDEPAALIFTDPPYPERYLPEWEALAEFARRALKPGHLLVTYSGQFYLPRCMAALAERLEYVWLGAIVTPGERSNQVHPRHIRSAAKPLFFFSNGPYTPGPWFDDCWWSEGRAKANHAWEQSVGAAAYYIERLTGPGALVVDPFLGSGTTAIAAQALGRRFVGCDVDEEAVATARRRVADAT